MAAIDDVETPRPSKTVETRYSHGVTQRFSDDGSYDGEELSPDDRFRWDRISRAYFRYWENAHYQYRNGLYDEDEFAGAREAWKSRLSRPGVAAIWCDAEEMYSPEFVAEIERLLPSGSSCAKGANPR